jgi:hypothetical protein
MRKARWTVGGNDAETWACPIRGMISSWLSVYTAHKMRGRRPDDNQLEPLSFRAKTANRWNSGEFPRVWPSVYMVMTPPQPKTLPDGLRDLIDLLADQAVADALAAAPAAPRPIRRWRPGDLRKKLDWAETVVPATSTTETE